MSCGHGELLLLPKTEKFRQSSYFPILNFNYVVSGCTGGISCC